MLILTNTSSHLDFQDLPTPGHVGEFLSPPFEPLRIEARSQGDWFFRLEVSYQYSTYGASTLENWSARRSAGNFGEKDHFRWNSGRRRLLGRAGRRVPTKFSINVPGARYVRWLRVNAQVVKCDISPDNAENFRSRLRLWLYAFGAGPNETADSYKFERPFVDLAKEPDVLQPRTNWFLYQKSHLRP